MSLIKTTSFVSLLLLLGFLVAGCGGNNQDPNADPQKEELSDIYGIYQMFVKTHQKPPAALSDLKQFQAISPRAYQLLQEGKYIAVWGVNEQSSETILAYEKDAPTNGGRAIMADGTVKRLDAPAFQNVPKPQK